MAATPMKEVINLVNGEASRLGGVPIGTECPGLVPPKRL